MSIASPVAGIPLGGARALLAWALALGWFASAVAAFWAFELRPLQAAPGGALAAFDGERLRAAAAPALEQARRAGRPLILHFRDASCPCGRLATPAVLEMARTGAAAGALSLLVPAPGSDASLPWGWGEAGLQLADPELGARLWATLPGAPAVAVFDAGGRLAWLGGYGSAGQCSDGRGPALAALKGVAAGDASTAAGGLAAGCFCAPRRGEIATNLLLVENAS